MSTKPTAAPIEIYLGKNGQTFGPYTPEQFEEIRAAADFATYSFIWDGRDASPDWKPLEKAAPKLPESPKRAGPGAPPPDDSLARVPAAVVTPVEALAPRAAVVIAQSPREATRPAATAKRPVLSGYDVPGIEALCLDARNVVAGRLTRVTDTGCELVCEQKGDNSPGFGTQSNVMLNLLDPASGRSMNVAARLGGVRRQDGAWNLKVLWDACPELIVEKIA